MAQPREPVVEPVPPTPPPPTTTTTTTSTAVVPKANAGSLVIRILLTLAGATGLIIGAFLPWLRGGNGVDLSVRSLWRTAFAGNASLITSVGMVAIILGLVAIVGLAPRSGWLTRLAGALGVVVSVLFVIEVYRAPGSALFDVLRLGFWLSLAGAVIALIGGFFGTRYRVAVTDTQTTPPPVPPRPA